MQLNITGQHMDVSPALKTHVQQKIKKSKNILITSPMPTSYSKLKKTTK